MKTYFKRILSLALIIALLFCSTVTVFAAEDEEYLSDLRLIYADDYEEAEAILADSELEDYKLFNANLNANTGKTGVWLAFPVCEFITFLVALFLFRRQKFQ